MEGVIVNVMKKAKQAKAVAKSQCTTWYAKSGTERVDVTNPSTNATYLKSTYTTLWSEK